MKKCGSVALAAGLAIGLAVLIMVHILYKRKASLMFEDFAEDFESCIDFHKSENSRLKTDLTKLLNN